MAITQLDAADYTKTYATTGPIGSDVNLVENDVPPRWMKFGTGGVVHVEYADGSDDTFSVQSGDVMPIKATALLCDTTTAEDITVGW